MRRILQMLSAVLLLLGVGLVWRITRVLQIEPPSFPEAVQTASLPPLAPEPARPKTGEAVIKKILEGNLFETERGYQEEESSGGGVEPLPPPTNVVLNGVLMMKGKPLAIMTDTKGNATQRTLRKGDRLGDYEVGMIAGDRVTLLGPGGQQFNVQLEVKKGGTAPVRRGTTVARPARPPVLARGARPVAPASTRGARPVRPSAAQPLQRSATTNRAPLRPRSTTARRPVPVRSAQQKTPAQARLEALKRLREAAAAARR